MTDSTNMFQRWRRGRAAGKQEELPIPPLKMREAVGPTDPSAFDNPEGSPLFGLPEGAYDSVFDFGCGCGRLARQLIQQQPSPGAYTGVDVNLALVKWCQDNLTPRAPQFSFGHHDVRHDSWNPGVDKPRVAPLPAPDGTHSLVIAFSVFTHLTQQDAEYYFAEVKRILARSGIFYSTWFLFDKRTFPMMQTFQNALYINEADPTNAVIFDRAWLIETAARNGLVITAAEQPEVRGFQWFLTMEAADAGAVAIELPPDEAPVTAEGRRAAAAAPDFSTDV